MKCKNSQWLVCYTFGVEIIGRCPGVYVIYLGEHVAYVGQSKNLRNRLADHEILKIDELTMWHPIWGCLEYERVTIKMKRTSTTDERLDLEAKLIRRLKPPFNRTGYPGAQGGRGVRRRSPA